MKPICFKTRGGGNYSGTKGAPIRSGKGGTGLLFYEDKTFTVATGMDQYIATFLCVTSPSVQEWKQPAWPGIPSDGSQSDSPKSNLSHVPSSNIDSQTYLTMETSPNTPNGHSQLEMWTSSVAGLPVRHFPSQVSGKGLQIQEGTLHWSFLDWLTAYAQSTSFGKTCPEFCPATEGKISPPSSGRWQNSGMGSLGGVLTLNSSVSHSGEKECTSSLSKVLETGELPQRFYLSQKACAGILRRAGKRGKALPPMLEAALRQAVSSGVEATKLTPSE